MEGGVPEKPVVVSDQFKKSRQNVYVDGIELFGFYQAGLYLDKILEALNTLPFITMFTPNAAISKPKAGCTETLSWILI